MMISLFCPSVIATLVKMHYKQTGRKRCEAVSTTQVTTPNKCMYLLCIAKQSTLK